MKLFPGKVSLIASEITRHLVDEQDIETESLAEVDLDVEAVLKEYIRTDRELTEQAKDLCEKKSMPFSSHMKIKRQLADKARFVIGDEALDYIMDQIIRAFMHSQFVDEIFAEDHDLKRKIRPILKRHTEIEDQIDEEVRSKIKNLEEGTKDWEIEYARALSQVKKRRSLD